MIAFDPQIARLKVLLADAGDRPSPEPSETELREILEHLSADTAAPQHPAEIAEAIAYLASERARATVGTALVVDAGYTAR